jgi:PAS domain S-box-containing protein
VRYGLAVLLTGLAGALRFVLDPWFGQQLPFITFFPAVAVAVWYAGLGPAVLSAGFGMLVANYFFMDARLSFGFPDAPAVSVHLVYLVGCALIILLGMAARRRQARGDRYLEALTESKESGSWLAAIVSASNDAIVGKTLDGSILSWNAGAEHLFGYTAGEAVGRPSNLIVPPELREEERSILERLGQGETIGHFETVRVHKDGRRIDVSLTVSPIRDESGRIVGVSKVARDVTEHKRALAALRESEERYRAVVESQAEMLCRFRLDGTILFANGAYARTQGTMPDALIGRSFWDFVPKDERPALRSMLERLTPETPEIRVENRFATTGGVRWTLWTNRALQFDAAGAVLEAQSTGIDITDHKRAEEALRESEQRFVRFMHHLPGLAWIKDMHGRYVYANDAAAHAFGMSQAQLYGCTDDEIFGPETAAQFRANDERALESAEGTQAVEILEHADGVLHHSLVSKFPIFGPDGCPLLVGGVAIDITERMRAEEALREAGRRKDDFLAVLGHELRNPLAPLYNGVELLKGAISDPAGERVRAMMERQLAHLLRLVNDLLDVSRISRGQAELQRATIDLRAVIDAAVEQAEPLMSERCHALTVERATTPVLVDADLERLVQVFVNLLSNAAKYTEAGGAVSLRMESDDRHVVVRVGDTGFGIPPERLQTLFETFHQVPEHRAHTGGGGLGLGLALSRQIVEMHGGAIEAKSGGLGLGSEFIVRLPLGMPAAEPAAVERPPRTTARGRRVLIVDDNLDAAESLRLILESQGHTVRAVSDGRAALEATERFRPDVVLLDIGLPQMDGYEVARRIRAMPQGQEILLCAITGWGQEEDKRRAREAGFDEHMTKPVDFAALASLVAAEPVSG